MIQAKSSMMAPHMPLSKNPSSILAPLFAASLFFLAVLFLAVPAQAKQGPGSFADLAKELTPMVVNVSTIRVIKRPGRRGQEGQPFPPGSSPFEEFFGQPMPRRERGPRKVPSGGSGFIISPDGYIVTNNHVIADAEEITIILHDDTNLKAKVVGRDPKTDLALLKVETKKPLPAIRWGDSDTAEVGDWVIAIGNPFGLGGSVTAGIISARAREIKGPISGPYVDFIQTDAPINSGNSGGPMFNMRGQVVGINSAILSPRGDFGQNSGNIGIGFAIPSSLAKPVIAQLKQYGHTRRGWLGVRIQEVTPEIAESLGMGRPRGAMVASVVDDSPAKKAKLLPGDVILRFADREIDKVRKLSRVVAETAVGKNVNVEIWRKGKKKTVKVEIGLMEEEQVAEAQEEEEPSEEGAPKKGAKVLGLSLASLSSDTREAFNLPRDIKGVVVVDVDENSAAMKKGIRPGDVITLIGQDHEEVNSPKAVVEKVEKTRKAGHKFFFLQVTHRGGEGRFLALRIKED